MPSQRQNDILKKPLAWAQVLLTEGICNHSRGFLFDSEGMMDLFPAWIIPKLEALGYSQTSIEPRQKFVEIGFNEQTANEFTVIYVHQAVDAQFIRNVFDTRTEPILFVVSFDCIQPFVASNAPLWVKALHAIYYGRVYTWVDSRILARHCDWSNGNCISSEVDLDGILFTDTDCKLKDFPGIFHIARFYDKAFWTESNSNKQTPNNPHTRQRKPPPSAEDVFRDFREAFERNKRHYQAYHDYEPVKPRYAPKGDKWLDLFIASGSIEAARAKYRELAKQFHPDLNPGSSEALSTMQAINIAFDKVKEYWK